MKQVWRACRVSILLAVASAPWYATASAPATAPPDLSGVWIATSYQPVLRTVDGAPPPLTPAASAVYQAHQAAARQGDHAFDLTVKQCSSPGMPRALFLPYPFEIIQRPQQVTFLFEWNHLFRIVPITLPRPKTEYAIAMGDSQGAWRNGKLVVTTGQLTDSTVLDAAGLPHSENLTLTETYTLATDGNSLQLRLRFEDAETFTAPWEASLSFRRLAGHRISEDICLDRMARGLPAIDPDRENMQQKKGSTR